MWVWRHAQREGHRCARMSGRRAQLARSPARRIADHATNCDVTERSVTSVAAALANAMQQSHH